MSRAAVALAAAALVAGTALATARADEPAGFWARATETADDELARRSYDEAMLAGDDHVAFAAGETVLATRRRMVEKAALAYEAASRARPDAAEPHYRAARVLNAFYLDCDPRRSPLCNNRPDRAIAERVIAHWDAFTRLAPLDPRGTDEIILHRALLHTKLATPEHLAAAAVDYEEMRRRMRDDARTDALVNQRYRRGLILGNLAETYMMLGDLDQAIVTYREALRYDPETSKVFGLAVALDRDEQRAEAFRMLRLEGDGALESLLRKIRIGDVFFVPEGEAAYYVALGAELGGDIAGAIASYEAFLRSGAHPRYAPRARANLARLRAQRPARRPGAFPASWDR